MHGRETRMPLKHCLDQGMSKAELSRRLGVSRRTIHHRVATGQLDRDLAAGATLPPTSGHDHVKRSCRATAEDPLASTGLPPPKRVLRDGAEGR